MRPVATSRNYGPIAGVKSGNIKAPIIASVANINIAINPKFNWGGGRGDSRTRSHSLDKRSLPDIGTPPVLKTCPIF